MYVCRYVVVFKFQKREQLSSSHLNKRLCSTRGSGISSNLKHLNLQPALPWRMSNLIFPLYQSVCTSYFVVN